jgi:hypothetical protein
MMAPNFWLAEMMDVTSNRGSATCRMKAGLIELYFVGPMANVWI